MATTTNYGWVTPDDTALVKDGAAAIRTLGSSADTTTKNLNPETTLGDLSFRSSTSDVNTRIGIGTAGQNLTVVAGVPAWATSAAPDSITLLSTTSLTGASVTISGIDQTYKNLYIIYINAIGSTNDKNRIAPNGTTNIANNLGNDGAAFQSNVGTYLLCPTANTLTSGSNFYTVTITNYASSTTYKSAITFGGNDNVGQFSFAVIESTTAITSLELSRGSGTFSSGTVEIYGVK